MWGANSIQFSWFVQSAEGLRAEAIYEALVAVEPDTVQRNKVPGPLNPLLSTAAGEDEQVAIQVQVQPGRVDVIVQPNENAQSASEELPSFDTHKYISRFISKVAEGGSLIDQPVNRISIVANLVQPVLSLEEGNALTSRISGYTPPVYPDSEFMVQLNSRAEMNGQQVNRLVRYSIMSVQQLVFSFDPQLGAQTSFPGSRRLAVNTMLDFNTVPDGSWIDVDRQRTIFKSISEEIYRVAETCELSSLS